MKINVKNERSLSLVIIYYFDDDLGITFGAHKPSVVLGIYIIQYIINFVLFLQYYALH